MQLAIGNMHLTSLLATVSKVCLKAERYEHHWAWFLVVREDMWVALTSQHYIKNL